MSSASTSPPESGKVVEYETYIDQQITKTRTHVKIVDLAIGLIVLGLTVSGSLMALVIIDHWILDLGFWARVVSLAAIVSAGVFAGTLLVLVLAAAQPRIPADPKRLG